MDIFRKKIDNYFCEKNRIDKKSENLYDAIKEIKDKVKKI